MRFASRNRRTGEIQYARRPSIQSRAMRPGCSIRARKLRHSRPSRSVSVPRLSVTRWARRRSSGRKRRWPQAAQYSPCIAAPQFAQASLVAIGPPRPLGRGRLQHKKTPGREAGGFGVAKVEASRLPPLLLLGGLHDLVGFGLGLRGGGLELALGDLADG